MNKTRKLKIYLATLLIIFTPFTVMGCWGRRETKQMNLTTALGVDQVMVEGNSKFRFTVLSTKTPSGSSGAGTSGGISEPQRSRASQVISYDGDTLWDAGRDYNLRAPRRLFIGQVIVVVVGEETARAGMGEILDFLLRHQDIRERVWLVVCQGSAADFLNAQPEEETIASVEIDGILKSAGVRTAKVKGIDLFNFSYDLITPGREAVLPYMTLFEPPEPSSPIRQGVLGTQNSSGMEQENQPQRKSFIANGFAVFQGNKMIGWINDKESQGLLYLTNQVKTAALPVAVDSSEKNVSIRIQESKTKITPFFSEGGLQFEVSIKATGDLMEEDDAVVKISQEDWKKVEELGAREIEKRCLAAVSKSQELKSDILGLGDKIHRTEPEEWKAIKDNWEQIFPDVAVNVKAELKIKQTGVSSDPIKVQ